MNDKFVTITQPFIENIVEKNTCVLELVMFYETRRKNAAKVFRVLSCVIYSIIENFVCIDYLAFKSKKISVICMDKKYLGNIFNKLLGIGMTDLLMNLLSFHGFTKNINSTVILLCPSRIMEYYFSKGFVMLESNSNNLMRIEN